MEGGVTGRARMIRPAVATLALCCALAADWAPLEGSAPKAVLLAGAASEAAAAWALCAADAPLAWERALVVLRGAATALLHAYSTPAHAIVLPPVATAAVACLCVGRLPQSGAVAAPLCHAVATAA